MFSIFIKLICPRGVWDKQRIELHKYCKEAKMLRNTGGQNMRLGLEVTFIYCIKKGSIMTFGTALFLTEPFFA